MHRTAVRAGLDVLVDAKTSTGDVIGGLVTATKRDGPDVLAKVEGDERWHLLIGDTVKTEPAPGLRRQQ